MKPDRWKLLVKISALLLLGLLTLILAGSTWDYSNSSKFCSSCHIMESVTSIHKTSAHAEVSCTSCHLGVGFSPLMLFKKAAEVNQLVKIVTGSYDKPMRIRHEVPAEKSCNKCHFPKLFKDVQLKVTEQFDKDENNTKTKTAVLFKIGNGAKGQGIHWHVENKITYGMTAAKEIVFVKLETATGHQGIYQKEGSTPVSYKQMDCIDCHNRIAHKINSPYEIIDQYFLKEKLDKSFPYLKREALVLFEKARAIPQADWLPTFAEIVDFYREEYPNLYNQQQEKINQLPEVLNEMANQIIFPNMEANWNTYSNKQKHDGCFQCHNSELSLAAEKSSPELPKNIRTDCQLCHSMPVTVSGDQQIMIRAADIIEQRVYK